MYITLRYADGFEIEVEVSDDIIDSGIVIFGYIAFVYESSSRFRQPVFVQQKIYYV